MTDMWALTLIAALCYKVFWLVHTVISTLACVTVPMCLFFHCFPTKYSTFRLGWQEFFIVEEVGLLSGVQLPVAVLSIFFMAAFTVLCLSCGFSLNGLL